MDNSETMAI